jgi:hypothetical protein
MNDPNSPSLENWVIIAEATAGDTLETHVFIVFSGLNKEIAMAGTIDKRLG